MNEISRTREIKMKARWCYCFYQVYYNNNGICNTQSPLVYPNLLEMRRMNLNIINFVNKTVCMCGKNRTGSFCTLLHYLYVYRILFVSVRQVNAMLHIHASPHFRLFLLLWLIGLIQGLWFVFISIFHRNNNK